MLPAGSKMIVNRGCYDSGSGRNGFGSKYSRCGSSSNGYYGVVAVRVETFLALK